MLQFEKAELVAEVLPGMINIRMVIMVMMMVVAMTSKKENLLPGININLGMAMGRILIEDIAMMIK